MFNAFFFVRHNEVEEIIECGLKLQDYYERQVKINGLVKKCILAYLNPADCYKYREDDYKIIKVRTKKPSSFVGEGAFFKEDKMDEYEKSILPLFDYKLSMYRKPECLITSTLLPEQIFIFDRRMDEPILYENSEDLYLANIYMDAKEEDENFKDLALEGYYEKLVDKGKAVKEDFIEYSRYIDKRTEKNIIIKKWR